MAVEKERKFLITCWPGNAIPNEFLSKQCVGIMHHIKQGYLMLQDGKQLRVRITDYTHATWAYKVGTEVDDERYEFEYEIPLQDAMQMMDTADLKIEKYRTKTQFKGLQIDIDFYQNSLVIAEIEMPFSGFVLRDDYIPDYIGVDVTGDKSYSNIELARKFSK